MRDLIETIEQAELGQFLDRVRQRVDADAELADRIRLLEYFAIKTASMQHERGRQPADAATDNNCLHALRSTQHQTPYHGRGKPPERKSVRSLW